MQRLGGADAGGEPRGIAHGSQEALAKQQPAIVYDTRVTILDVSAHPQNGWAPAATAAPEEMSPSGTCLLLQAEPEIPDAPPPPPPTPPYTPTQFI